MDQIIDVITNPAVLTGILTVLTVVMPFIGLPAWATAIIGSAAAVATKAIEQTHSDKTPAEKKAAAVAAVLEEIPAVLRVLPGTANRIDRAIEAKVLDLP